MPEKENVKCEKQTNKQTNKKKKKKIECQFFNIYIIQDNISMYINKFSL